MRTPAGKKSRTFATRRGDWLTLAHWLVEPEVSQVAMESTGGFWKPVYNLLEEAFTVLVLNAQHIKAVPGRKTEVKDAEWIADLLRASFIPEGPPTGVAGVVRDRRRLVGNRAQGRNRIQLVLEGANIQLAWVATKVVGVSGRAMLVAWVRGTDEPKVSCRRSRRPWQGSARQP